MKAERIFAILVIVALSLAFSGLTSAQQISICEAEKIASRYASGDEHVKYRISVYHNNTLYHVIDFFKYSTRNGLLIVDATSGDIVRDEDIAKEIFYTVKFMEFISPETLNEDLPKIDLYRRTAIEMKMLGKHFSENAKTAGISYKLKECYNNLASSCELVGNDFSTLEAVMSEIYEIEKRLLEKKDTKLVKDLTSKKDEFLSYVDTYNSNANTLKNDTIIFYDTRIAETTNPTEKASLEAEKRVTLAEITLKQQSIDLERALWESQKSEIEENVVYNLAMMSERVETRGIPGFEVIFTICGLLAVAYLIRRGKEDENK